MVVMLEFGKEEKIMAVILLFVYEEPKIGQAPD